MMYAESEAEMQDWIDAVLREMSPGSNSVVAPSTGSSSSPSLLEDKGSERSPTGVKFGLLLNRFKSSSTGLKKDKKEPKSLPQQTSIDKKALDVVRLLAVKLCIAAWSQVVSSGHLVSSSCVCSL
jgi:hypothetical protein